MNNIENEKNEVFSQKVIEVCPQCGKPKKLLIDMPWINLEKEMLCSCDCDKERIDKYNNELMQKERESTIRKIQKSAFQDIAYTKMTFDSDDSVESAASKMAHRYCNKFDNLLETTNGLLLYGNPGGGKTFYAACIANELLSKGKKVWMIKLPSLISQIQRDHFKTDYAKLINTYDLMIFDDFGVERNSEYVLEQIFNIIDDRYLSGKPMLFTTNLPLTNFENSNTMYAERINSRILERCFPVEIVHENRRKTKNQYNQFLELLNN